jgi:hypothetical protein
MSIRIYKLEGGSAAKSATLGFVVIGLGLLLLGIGLTLLIAAALVGAAIGGGVMLYRRLTGQPVIRAVGPRGNAGLDPSLEVFAEDVRIDGREVREPPESLPPGQR